jgi:hypothetical protein
MAVTQTALLHIGARPVKYVVHGEVEAPKTSSGGGLEFDACGKPGPMSMTQRRQVLNLRPIGKSRWGQG